MMRGDELGRVTLERLQSEVHVFQLVLTLHVFALTITAVLAGLAATSHPQAWVLHASSAAALLALSYSARLMYGLRKERVRVLLQMRAAFSKARVTADRANQPVAATPTAQAAPSNDSISPQLRQVFDQLGPDTTKH